MIKSKKNNQKSKLKAKKAVSAAPNRFSTWRENIVLCLVIVVGLILVVRAGFLQIFEKDYLQSEGNDRYLRLRETAPLRGVIHDRNGSPLAVSTPVDSIWVNPKVVLQKRRAYEFSDLARFSGKSGRDFYYYLVKNAKTEEITLKQNISDEEKKIVKKLGMKGVAVRKRLIESQDKKEVSKEFDVVVKPQVLINEQDKYSLKRFAKLLDLKQSDVLSKIKKNSNREYLYIKRHVDPAIAKDITDLNIAGINTKREYRRFYPAAQVASHIIGFTNIDNVGQEGIELIKNKELNGDSGRAIVLQDKVGRIVEEVERQRPVRHGEPLTLSIDSRIQYLAYRHLKAAVEKNNATGGSLVALDVATGDVLAMVNMPDYNPNDRSDFSSHKFRNRSIADTFEPGSTVKPFAIAMAIEAGEVDPDTVIETNGVMRIGGRLIEDTKNHGDITVSDVIVKSSNIGSVKIATKLPAKQLVSTYSNLGFGKPTHIELNGKQSGLLDTKRRWRPVEHATLSYGYGLSATALQLARAYTALAGDGTVKSPSLIYSEKPRDKKGQEARAFSKETVEKVRVILEKVVSPEGTARQAMMENYTAAGKTGTVHKVKKAGGYYSDKYLSLFAGFAPADNPKVVMVVVIDDPRGDDYYGGRIAGPVFSKVMEGTLRFMNVKPDRLTRKVSKNSVAHEFESDVNNPRFEVVQ